MPLITVTAGVPAIPAGTYPATLVGIAPKRMVTKFSTDGKEQDFLEWTWLIESPDKDVEITSLTSTSVAPKSRIFEYLTALLGAQPDIGTGFEENDLVGKKVMVSTIETPEGFAKIDRVVPAMKGRQNPAAPVEKVVAPDAMDDLPF